MNYQGGTLNHDLRICILGMVARSSNTVILYPVSDRTSDVLIPIIIRHAEREFAI